MATLDIKTTRTNTLQLDDAEMAGLRHLLHNGVGESTMDLLSLRFLHDLLEKACKNGDVDGVAGLPGFAQDAKLWKD